MKQKKVNQKKAYTFRQWSRKPYAVFNSLKLLIKISVMSAVYTLVNPAQETKAQTDSTQVTKKIEIEDIEISGQRTPVVSSQMARIVSLVTRSEIEQAPVISVNDLLKYIPQTDIRQRGVNGVQADISIQGGSFDQTLILLNGINLTDPQTGHHNLNLPINIENIDRIEVLKGPSSRVFGTNAFSGAINFITGQNPKNYVNASVSGGDFGLYQGTLTVNQHSDKVHNILTFSKGASNGYIHNTNYNQTNAFYHGKIFINKHNIGLQLGYIQKDFGANSFYSPKYPNQFEATNTYFGSIGAEIVSFIKLTPSLYWRRNYDHYILNHTNPLFYQNFHYTDAYGAGINSNFQTLLGKTSVGFDYRKEIIYSTNLGTPIDNPKKIPGEDSIKYLKNDERQNLSIYLEHNIYVGKFSASGGLMINKNTKLKNIQMYPGIDMSYPIIDMVRGYVSLNRSLRLPSFTDLYYQGPQNIGNPGLKPEQAWTIESGLKLDLHGFESHISYFHRWGKNIIDWIWQTNVQKWETENLTSLNTNGIEIFTQINIRKVISKSLIKRVTASYSFTSINKNSSDYISYYVLDNLKHKLVLGLDHDIIENLGATWYLTWQDRNGNYGKYDAASATSTETPYKPFVLFDGKIYYKYKFIDLFVEATNIFNVNYFDLGNITQPGRWFKAGINVNVGWANSR
jgi:iron complex outermembrane receptor protein